MCVCVCTLQEESASSHEKTSFTAGEPEEKARALEWVSESERVGASKCRSRIKWKVKVKIGLPQAEVGGEW